MRIAIVCPYAWDRVGGVQTHIRGLSAALRRRGHDVAVVAPRAGLRAADAGVTIVGRAVPVPANGSVAPVALGPGAAARLRRALRDLQPDVLHLHEPFAPSLSLLALLGSEVPSLGTFHASGGASLAYSAAAPVLRRVAGRLAARSAVSDAAREFVSRYVPGSYALTPNGIDTSRFADVDPLDLGPGPLVLFVSRVEERKGLDFLIQAMARIRDLGATLVVAGDGPRTHACRLLARRLMVPTRWLGRLSDDDLPRAYRAADVFCAPAVGGESFGIVLAEAMAAGAPVVCSDIPGFRAVAGGAAELAPPRDPGRLADALRLVLTDSARRAQMTATGRNLAGMFDWERLVAGVESLLLRAVGEAT